MMCLKVCAQSSIFHWA